MSKKRKTFSLDPEVYEHLSTEGVNASGLVNQLVKNHATSGGDSKAMLELREQQLESEVRELEQRLESKRDDLELVREQLDEHHTSREEILTEASNTLRNTPITRDSPAVKTWAEKAGMGVEEFIDALREHEADHE